MTILSISRDWGTTPSIVRINDNATLSTITATGYVFAQAPVIEAIQKGEFEWAPTDEVLISYADGKGYFTYNSLTGTFIAQEDPFGTVTAEEVQRAAFNTSAATGADDAFVVTLDPAVTALTDGLTITMDSGAFQNLTASPTLKVNALPAKPIVTFAGSPAPGDIQQNNEYIFVYSLTNDHFQLINPSTTTADTFQVQSSGYSYALDTGVANAYIANILPAQLTTQSGLQVVMTAVNANTGASTLTVNGITHPIVLSNGAALTGGEILVDGIYQFFYSAALTAFVLMNASSSVFYINPEISYTGTWISPVQFTLYNSSLYSDGVYNPNILTATFDGLFPEPGLTSLNLGGIQNLSNGLTYNMQGLASFTADSLIQINGNFTALFVNLASPSTLSFPALKYINGAFTPSGRSGVTINANLLLYVGGNFGPGSFSTINATALTYVRGNLSPSMSIVVTLNLPALITITGNMTMTFSSMTSFIATSLTTIQSIVTTFTVLTDLNLPALTTLTNGAFQPTAPLCTSVTVTSLSVIGSNITCSFAILTSLSFPALTSVGENSGGTITITAPEMTTFSMGPNLIYVGGNVTLTGMKLNQTSVDGILVSLAALDGTGGTVAYSGLTVNLSGGTSATPGAAGLAAKATLEGRGCTVTVN